MFTQAETDTRASGFGCEKRNEDFIQSFRDDARSVVLDVDGDLSGVGLGGDADQGSRYKGIRVNGRFGKITSPIL